MNLHNHIIAIQNIISSIHPLSTTSLYTMKITKNIVFLNLYLFINLRKLVGYGWQLFARTVKKLFTLQEKIDYNDITLVMVIKRHVIYIHVAKGNSH